MTPYRHPPKILRLYPARVQAPAAYSTMGPK